MIPDKSLINIKKLKIQNVILNLKEYGCLEKKVMEEILKLSFSILKKQQNILSLTSPCIVVGDIHGQFYDLLTIFQKYNFQESQFLFLGDYVDRGQFCMEVLTLLIILKIKFPSSIHLLRGNHQGRDMTTQYNFKEQCVKKYSIDMYQMIIDWFKMLPLAAVVDGKYFCVHGGISPEFTDLKQIQKIRRNIEIPQKGLICDFLWSDPTDDDEIQWESNTNRGVSYYFSKAIANKFLRKNNFKMIIRAHQLYDEGFKFQQSPDDKKSEPVSLTLFSAPNYCDKFQNKGAIAVLKNNQICIETFSEMVHPFILPNYMNVFQWTLPFLSVCIGQMVKGLTNQRDIKRTESKNIKQIKKQVQDNQQSLMIEKLFYKILQQKNECHPIVKRATQKTFRVQSQLQIQNLSSLSIQKIQTNSIRKILQIQGKKDNQNSGLQKINPQKLVSQQKFNVFGPKNLKFEKLNRKILNQSRLPLRGLDNK